jgi:glutamate-ammonia-ligase adenylyltransferase
VADAALTCLLPRIEDVFAATHGRIAGCALAIIGMGKLGGREMTVTSDLDLIFVYATTEGVTQSDGRRPLAPPQYFARLSQRLIAALTAPTAEGRLYEVDMRLRPSGKAGPIAVSAETFARYQRDEAWVWEQMALTRARVVAGPAPLVREIDDVIRRVLVRPRDPAALVVEVADMRARMADEHRAASIWEVKHLRGGMVDIEFIAQYLQLLHARALPGVLSANTAEALARLREAGVLATDAADELLAALRLWQAVQNRIRLNLGHEVGPCDMDDAPKALRLAVEGIAGLTFPALVARMQATADRVHTLFRLLVDEPAATVRHTRPEGFADRTAAG